VIINLRTRKILRDIWRNKTRTALVILTIAVGVFAIGSISRSWVILARNLSQSFEAINPASASISTQEHFANDIIRIIERMPDVRQAEGRANLIVRVNVGPNEWRRMLLVTRADFEDLKINQLTPDSGQWPPAKHKFLVERSSLSYLNLSIGEAATLKIDDGSLEEIELTGTVHDINRIPTAFTNTIYGYITPETYQFLTNNRGFNTLDIVVEDNGLDEEHIQQVVANVVTRLEANDLTINLKWIPEPGKHPLDSIIQSFLWLLGALAGLVLLLGAFLVLNIITAILSQQIKQIGIIKSIGGRSSIITRMYLNTVIIYSLLALVISVPLGMLMAYFSSTIFASMVNFDITDFSIPPYIYALEIFSGLGLPVLAALVPIVSGTRISVRQAISQAGVSSTQIESSGFEKLLKRLQGLPMTFRYALRNIFRKKVRLALTLIALSMAGAIFVAVITVRVSLATTIDEIAAYWQEDINIEYYQPHLNYKLDNLVSEISGIERLEGRFIKRGYRVRPDGSEATDSLTIYGISPQTAFLTPRILAGRWLNAEDQQGVVISTGVQSLEPDLSIGSEIEIKIDGETSSWEIVGIVTSQVVGGDTLVAPIVYAPYEQLSRTISEKKYVNQILIATNNREQPYVDEIAKIIEDRFDSTDYRIASKSTLHSVRASLENFFFVSLALLQLMSFIFATVGGLGLMSMMSLNVLERTQEMGLLRVVGSSQKVIYRIVVTEGVLTGLISWLIGLILAYPLANFMGQQLGIMLIYSPLSRTLPVLGAGIWLMAVIILSVIASLLPARSASKLSVRETISFE